MNDTVREWIDKAETDYRVAERELAVDSESDYGPVCFHAQQCVVNKTARDWLILRSLRSKMGLSQSCSAPLLLGRGRVAIVSGRRGRGSVG